MDEAVHRALDDGAGSLDCPAADRGGGLFRRIKDICRNIPKIAVYNTVYIEIILTIYWNFQKRTVEIWRPYQLVFERCVIESFSAGSRNGVVPTKHSADVVTIHTGNVFGMRKTRFASIARRLAPPLDRRGLVIRPAPVPSSRSSVPQVRQ